MEAGLARGTGAAARGPIGIRRWAGLGAIAYVVLFVAGVSISDSGVPDFDAAPAKVIAYWHDSGHRDKAAIGWGLVLLSVFFLLFFLAELNRVLRPLDPDGFLTTLATLGGGIYAALALTGPSIDVAIKTMSDDTYHHQVYPDLIHAGRDAAYIVHSAGGVGAAALIIGATLIASRAALIRRWAAVIGVIIGILAIASIFFFPQILIALWLIVAGVALVRAGRRPAGPAVASGTVP